MLPKYANLENENNNFIFASKQLQNFRDIDTSAKDTILKSASSTISSGIAPKNELEEFNSNLTEINTYITQLKTYVKDSLNKGYYNAKQQIDEFAERPELQALDTETEKEYQKENRQVFEKIVEKEANNIGKLPPLKQISLFQGSSDTEMSGSGRLLGAGVGEREALQQQYDTLNEFLIKLEQSNKLFSELYREFKLEKDEAKKQALEEALAGLAEAGQREFTDFPIEADINLINQYFKNIIQRTFEEMKNLKEEIKQDYLGEKETMKPAENATIGTLEENIAEVKRMSETAGAETPEDIAKFKAIKDKYGVHGNTQYKAVISHLEGLRRPLVKTRKTEKEAYKKVFAPELAETQAEIEFIEQHKIERLEKIQKSFDAINKEIRDNDDRIAELQQRDQELKDQSARAMALGKQKQAERALAEAQKLDGERIAREEEAQRLQDEAEALQAEAEILQLKLTAEADARERQQLKDKENLAKLKEVKAVGALAMSSPSVNPIISTLTKLISLITKENILFNGKIKKNINLLDRLDVEDLISKLNKVIINLQSIPNQSYISVSIENGYEMLKQLYDALNKLSFDVGNGVYSYTSTLRGGSRHYNDHYQYYSRMTVNDNPHIYKYMM